MRFWVALALQEHVRQTLGNIRRLFCKLAKRPLNVCEIGSSTDVNLYFVCKSRKYSLILVDDCTEQRRS